MTDKKQSPQQLITTLTTVLVILGLFSLAWVIVPTIAAPGDVGYEDFNYGSASAPTGQKPQSKLWYNDGSWWGILYSSDSPAGFKIYRFNSDTQQWASTGVLVDARARSSADALWTGTKLYVVSNMTPTASGDQNIFLMRFSYDPGTQTYSPDAGSPISLWPNATETVVIDQDTTGMLWVTFTADNAAHNRDVYVTHSTVDDASWVVPYIIPVVEAQNINVDDISTLVSYNGKIGVMWSDQNTDSIYFATHVDGLPDKIWAQNPALQGPKYADDHLNIKSLQADSAGQVFAAVKTSLNDVNPSSSTKPEILLLTLDGTGSWSRRTVARIVDNHTRPIVLLDNENRQIYVFMTLQYGTQTSGAIYYKQASLDNPSMQFPEGLGTPFIEFASSDHINNASSTKQRLNSTTNLLVIAGDDSTRLYFHNYLLLGTPKPTSTSSPTQTPTDTPTVTATSTNTATWTPTSTNTPTDTPTVTATSTNTATWTPTTTNTPTNTPTDTPTVTATSTNTATWTPTTTNTPTNTATWTPTSTSTFTNTPTTTTQPTATFTATKSSGTQDPKIYLPLIMR